MTSATLARRTAHRAARLIRLAELDTSGSAAEILVIRRAAGELPGAVPATGMRPPPAWDRALAAVVADARRGAVLMDGRPVPAAANAVLFQDRADMMALFARDVVAGVTTGWWWQALFRETGPATHAGVAALWTRHARHVPAAMQALVQLGVAGRVSVAFPDDAVHRILRAVLAAHLPPATPAGGPRRQRDQQDAQRPGQGSAADHLRRLAGHEPAATTASPWSGMPFAPQVPIDLPPAPRLLMGVCLMLHRAPLLAASPAYIQRVADALVAAGGEPFTTGGERSTTPTHGAATSKPTAGPARHEPIPEPDARQVAGDASPPRAPSSSVPDAAPSDPDPAAKAAPTRALETTDAAAALASPRKPRLADAPIVTDATPRPAVPAGQPWQPWVDTTEIHSGLCGVFFLVNALRSGRFLDDVVQQHPDAELASGWAWLELFATALGARALNPDDPVWPLLARLDGRAAGVTDVPAASINQVAWQVRDPVRRLRRRLQSALDAEDPAELADALFPRAGVVRATRAHVDVHMPLDTVSVPVRLAGLDADPGWVAAFGRVITFHYV